MKGSENRGAGPHVAFGESVQLSLRLILSLGDYPLHDPRSPMSPNARPGLAAA